MTNYDYPNEEELQPYVQYNYDLNSKEYPIKKNTPVSDYNQFIQLRDTLVYSGKYYKGKGGCKLVVGDKENTIELLENNLFQQNFDSMTGGTPTSTELGPYVKRDATVASNYGTLSCVIQKNGRYKIIHKEEVLLNSGTNKVYCYVDVYRPDGNGGYTMPYKGGVAVFDWECQNSPLSGSTDDGSCSVPFTFGQLFKKVTAYGYMERDLLAGDILVLRARDADINPDGSPSGNDLTFQTSSNYRSIEYLNLPIN